MDWLDLLAVQGTLESLLQHHSSKASILWHSAFFTVQLLYPYITTGKTIALTRWTFVGKVMSLLLNMLSIYVGHNFPSRSGAAAERSNPTSKERWLHGHRRAERSYSTFKVRRGGSEEISLIQDKKQRLRFAGAAVKT